MRNAANMADYVIVNSHSHEPGNDSVVPPEWLRVFVKKCLDAGGTTFVVHGPHQVRGIEVYKGKPIFYSLGNFVFQNETIDPMPADHYEQFDLPDTALSWTCTMRASRAARQAFRQVPCGTRASSPCRPSRARR